MSFQLKQAINELTIETQDLLTETNDLKASNVELRSLVTTINQGTNPGYTKLETYSASQVDAKFTNLIDSAPAALDTLKELAGVK